MCIPPFTTSDGGWKASSQLLDLSLAGQLLASSDIVW